MTEEIEDMFDELANEDRQEIDGFEDAYEEDFEEDDYYDEQPTLCGRGHTCRSCTHYGTNGLQAFCDDKQDEIYDICDTCESWSPRY